MRRSTHYVVDYGIYVDTALVKRCYIRGIVIQVCVYPARDDANTLPGAMIRGMFG